MAPELRPGGAADLPALTHLYNHYIRETPATFDTEPFTVAARRGWFEQFASTGPLRLIVVCTGESLVGWACSTPFRPRAAYRHAVETSVYLAPEAVGAGLGTRLYDHLLAELITAEVHRCYGLVTLPNAPSMALHRRLGFTEVGRLSECGRKFDRWWDVAIMERRL